VNLSPNFTLAELVRSETAARQDIDMAPSPEVLTNLSRLCNLVLEPIRHKALRPIVVTSGYRPKALNDLVGGSKSSDHLTGCAADIHALGITLDELERVVRSISEEIPLKQCIAEFGQWLHVSVQPEGAEPWREFLAARREDGKTVYSHV
jgi:zinc D-Ala-D-Ala carboxypeptidase